MYIHWRKCNSTSQVTPNKTLFTCIYLYIVPLCVDFMILQSIEKLKEKGKNGHKNSKPNEKQNEATVVHQLSKIDPCMWSSTTHPALYKLGKIVNVVLLHFLYMGVVPTEKSFQNGFECAVLRDNDKTCKTVGETL